MNGQVVLWTVWLFCVLLDYFHDLRRKYVESVIGKELTSD